MLEKNHKRLNENGFASIAIALVLIAVLSLLTVGFAQLARREQQNALNKQLASQAFYASESGVNDAVASIRSGALNTGTPKEGGTQCMDLPLPGAGSAAISTQNGVSYTCVLVNLQPKTLEKDMAADGDWTTYFSTVGGTPDSVTLNWTSKDGQPPRSTTSGFTPVTPAGTWGARAVMQFSITPLSSYSRDQLIANTFNVYGYPTTATGSAAYSNAASSQGQVISANCDSAAGGLCHVTITGLPAGVSLYALHVHDYYDASHVGFSAFAGPTALPLGDSQATIDSTGKAREVLKRIQVHIPIHPPNDLPSSSLEAQDICKYFTTDPVSNTQNASLPGYGAGVTSTCDVTN
jgi:Tfp pilus assembly protein PilX